MNGALGLLNMASGGPVSVLGVLEENVSSIWIPQDPLEKYNTTLSVITAFQGKATVDFLLSIHLSISLFTQYIYLKTMAGFAMSMGNTVHKHLQ